MKWGIINGTGLFWCRGVGKSKPFWGTSPSRIWKWASRDSATAYLRRHYDRTGVMLGWPEPIP